ncbi:ATP synthase F0 subunit B [Candidatus Gracilibacteria bacterium 28_42_T64]|nr:ATP synthase F0 subunit B [Candidatus Gracilibacteria bacterium 28_42_T64]
MDDLKLGIVIAQLINFGILFFLFKHFLGEKIIKAIEGRRENLQKFDDAELKAKELLDDAVSKADLIMTEAREKASNIEIDSDALAKKGREKILATADMEAKSIIDNALGDIEKERLSMANALKAKVVDLSLKINKKLFDEEKINKEFIEKEIKSL